MMPDVMQCLRNDLAGIKPNFILATGDISSHQTRDAMFASRDLMDSLGFPYYPMGGNHDFVLEDSRKWFLEAFHAQLPTQSTVYSFDYENLHFAVLDPWWKWSDDSLSEVSEKAIAEKLEKDLKGARWSVPPPISWSGWTKTFKPTRPRPLSWRRIIPPCRSRTGCGAQASRIRWSWTTGTTSSTS